MLPAEIINLVEENAHEIGRALYERNAGPDVQFLAAQLTERAAKDSHLDLGLDWASAARVCAEAGQSARAKRAWRRVLFHFSKVTDADKAKLADEFPHLMHAACSALGRSKEAGHWQAEFEKAARNVTKIEDARIVAKLA